MMRLIIFCICLILYSGCGPTADPYIKLEWVRSYSEHGGRLYSTQTWLHEAITTCQKRNYKECLSLAYMTYGLYLKSKAFRKDHPNYGKGFRFMDKSITFENRLKKSEEYFDKAIALKPKDENF